MTYLQRINYLDRKIEKAKEKIQEIEELHGYNTMYQKKQMEIEEFEHLKSWYNKKIIADYEHRKHMFCRIKNCKYYQRGSCFINKIPKANKCDYCEECD